MRAKYSPTRPNGDWPKLGPDLHEIDHILASTYNRRYEGVTRSMASKRCERVCSSSGEDARRFEWLVARVYSGADQDEILLGPARDPGVGVRS